jgi:xylose isomerase
LGHDTLLNTNMKLELDNMARFLRMAAEYAKEIGFTGQLLVEPKPKEPTVHQYDFDTAAVIGFLRHYGLADRFKVNIEQNHAILAGHSYQHEIHFARINDMLGSLDVNQGDYLLGWDTDQLNTNLYEAVLMLYEVLKAGGIAPGGMNFDAKLRRPSFQPDDIFIAHIASMDTYARALKTAHALLKSREIEDFVTNRYASYETGIGKDIVEERVGFKELEKYAFEHDQIENASGRREMLEGIINRYV